MFTIQYIVSVRVYDRTATGPNEQSLLCLSSVREEIEIISYACKRPDLITSHRYSFQSFEGRNRKSRISTVLFPERSWIHGGIRLGNKLFKPNPMPCVSIHLSRSETLWTSRTWKLTDHGKLFDRSIVDYGRALSVCLGHSVDISDGAIVNQCLCRPFWII
jgi:hypothetical protein